LRKGNQSGVGENQFMANAKKNTISNGPLQRKGLRDAGILFAGKGNHTTTEGKGVKHGN